MAKINEADLLKALIAIIRADTADAGASLLELMQARNSAIAVNKMVVQWGDPAMSTERPIIAVHVGPAAPNRGSKERLSVEVQIDAFTERAAGSLGPTLLDRCEELITYTALKAQGIEAAPWLWSRDPMMPEMDEGGMRSMMRTPIWLER